MKTILQEAEEIIKERRPDYGPVTESFEAVAQVWSALLRNKLKEPLAAPEVGILMSAFKLVRESNQHKRDNLVDASSYNELTNIVHSELEAKTIEARAPKPIKPSCPKCRAEMNHHPNVMGMYQCPNCYKPNA
jgi:hypothetical protein